MNRLDLQTRVLERLNESVTSPVFWTTAQIQDLLQDSQELIAEEARLCKRTINLATRPGCAYYQMRGIASDCMAMYRLILPDNRIRLRAVSSAQLDAYHLLWETVSGTPRWWSPIDWQTFALFPHPIQGGANLRIDYLAWPPALLDDFDTPEFGQSEQDNMVIYGVYAGLMKRWDVGRATSLFAEFMQRISRSKATTGVEAEEGRTWQEVAEP